MFSPNLEFWPMLSVTSSEQIQQIQQATLEVLGRTGVQITHPHALDLLHSSGGRVKGHRVCILTWVVEEALNLIDKIRPGGHYLYEGHMAKHWEPPQTKEKL
jgi:trimethylamine:corrinoid methyltransferase-like protein